MKNFTYLIFAGLFSFVGLSSLAQPSQFGPAQTKKLPGGQVVDPPRNCPTFELMEKAFQADPSARLRYAYTQQLLQERSQQNRTGQQFRIEAIINIPVVVHVLLPTAQQSLVTDAIIQSQIDTLNFYYGGSPFNSDSLRVYDPFRTTYGRSQIRFCMAQRTPTDLPTNGIDRVINSTVFGGSGTHPGSIVVWDPTKYLNIWVVNFGNSGVLGYSYTPGTWAPSDFHQGFVNDYRAFGAGPGTSAGGYHYNLYNQGKTAVHEIGHYFNLLHPWGPNNSGNPGCTLSDLCSDTPPTSAPFFGCPSSVPVLDPCSPAAPGIMWQNHMDYADDRCMVLFTNEQCARMMIAVQNAPDRITLLTSNGCVAPPVSPGNDASISTIINPPTGSSTACSSVTPVVTLKNLGSSALTSVQIITRLDGNAVGLPYNWIGSLTQGQTVNVTLPSFNIATNGAHTIKIHSMAPNNQADATPANDTSTSLITKIAPAALPTGHNFEGSFLPGGWSVVNPDGDITWIWASPGASGTDNATAIDNYNYDLQGFTDDIRTTAITTTGLLASDSILITWDLAHKNFPDPTLNDSLKILVSNDCGTTWTTIWSKGGADLATAGASTGFYTTPVPADWKKQRATIGTNIFGAGQVLIAFRNVNGYGNVVWIDNINIAMKPRIDMQALTMLRPNFTECTSPFAPSLTVRNNGGETVTGFKTGYRINNGAPVIQAQNVSLAPGASATVNFPNLPVTPGVYTIKLFVADPITPSPGSDVTPGNDTLVRSFIVPVGNFPTISEGFEGSTFVPANWFLINPDNSITWAKAPSGKSSSSSAFVDNYNYATNVYLFDYLQTPLVNTAGADSLIITFDLAHKVYEDPSGTSVDNLSVLVSRNCSPTFSTVYSKTGITGNPATSLATAGSAGTDAYLIPAQGDWRRERIAVDLITTPANTVLVQFRNGDAYGNNVFIDNINMIPVFKRDIEVQSLTPDIACSTAGYTPVARVHNRGKETVTGFTIAYTIGTGTPVTQNVTGITLAPDGIINVTLGTGTLVAGANNIKVYTSLPITVSGTGDQLLANDTLAKVTYATAPVTAPASVVETFEGSFIPNGWAISNADNALTWQKSGAGKNSLGSAVIRNYTYFSAGQRDLMFTPVLVYNGVDSVKLAFDLSAATKDYPGSTNIGMDTLEVLVTKDCGATFTSVYKKWGTQLQTIGDANSPQPTEFIPNGPALWRTEYIDLTGFGPNGPLQVVFRNTTNTQNDVYIDNVNFRTVTLPALLKKDGVIATPNPFSEQFALWFIQPQTDLRYITVLNASGQQVWKQEYTNGSNSNLINVNLSGFAAGVYVIHIGYSNQSNDKKVRIIKSN